MKIATAFVQAMVWIMRYFVERRRRPLLVPGLGVLHAATNGRLDRLLSRGVVSIENRLTAPPRFPVSGSGIFHDPVMPHVENLRRDGITVFSSTIPPDMVAALQDFVAQTDQNLVGDDGVEGVGRYPDGPPGRQFKIDSPLVCADPTMQVILADPFLAQVAGSYFGSTPVVSSAALWWNTVREHPSSWLAQKYHWDNAGFQWVHVFIYLVDVDETTGPHVFVKGSHVPVAERASLAARGTVRIDDADVEHAFPGRATPICGPAGTVFMADTWGLHKAALPVARDRLVVDLMFNNSLLGINSPQPHVKFGPVLEQAVLASPRTYQWLR